jgi:small conductance mechanosensitive channel
MQSKARRDHAMQNVQSYSPRGEAIREFSSIALLGLAFVTGLIVLASPTAGYAQSGQVDEPQSEASTVEQQDAADAAEASEQTGAADPKGTTDPPAGEAVAKAVDALKSGDLRGAAKHSSALLKTYVIPAAIALVLLIVAYFIASFLARVGSIPVRQRVDETLGRFVGKLIFYLIMICAILGVLDSFGIGITGFAALLASAGFAVGLAFQGTLSNVSAGVMLLVFRPFKVGDVIQAAGITAQVDAIGLFTTTLDTPDNRRIIVPNSAIAGGTIENISFHAERRVEVVVGVDYGADLQQVRDTLTVAAESLHDALIEREGRGFQVALGDLGDSAVQWKVRFWTTADEYWSVKERLTVAVKEHLDRAGIGIPYPRMDIHIDRAESPEQRA